MYKLFIWVPCSGWKLIKKFKSAEDAKALQVELFPLETKVTGRHTCVIHGKCCMPLEGLSD